MNRSVLLASIALALSSSLALADSTISQVDPVASINTKDELAVHGYDAVSYFTDGKPQHGAAQFEYMWHGARWQFVSAQHRDQFAKNPERYEPQFGGYCALAVSLGRIADGDPEQWAVVNDKLFLNNNPRAKAAWDEDRPGNIVLGQHNWPLIPKRLDDPAAKR